MDHYEIRTYEGWHHHMLTTLLAHFFLWRLKIGLEKKITRIDRATVAASVGRGAAATALDKGAEISPDRLGAKAQSPSLLLTS